MVPQFKKGNSMRDDVLVGVIVGFMFGSLVWITASGFKHNILLEKVASKQTISQGGYYAQYSAVRRFPK